MTPAAGEPRDWPQVRADVLRAELDDDLVLFDPASQRLVVLNHSAALIWSCCDGSASAEDIAEDIAAAFAVEEAEVRCQVEQLLAEWAELGLLVEPEGPGRA